MTDNNHETEWEGFDTLEYDEVVQSVLKSLESGPASKKKSRKLDPSIRKNALQLQNDDLLINKDGALGENLFKALEHAVNDEVDGIMTDFFELGLYAKLFSICLAGPKPLFPDVVIARSFRLLKADTHPRIGHPRDSKRT